MNARPHIVHITPYYAPEYAFGGVVRMVQAMAEGQAARGHPVTVITAVMPMTDTSVMPMTDTADAADAAENASTAITGESAVRVVRIAHRAPVLRTRLNLGTPFGIGRALDAALRAASGVSADVRPVVHVHELRTVENLLALPAVRGRAAVVVSPHGTLSTTTGRSVLKRVWDGVFTPGTAAHIAGAAALHTAEADEVRALWARLGRPAPHIAIVPNGIEMAAYAHLPGRAEARARFGLPEDAFVALFMGRLHPRKGAHLLAGAAAAHPSAWALIAGGDEGGLASAQRTAGGCGRVVFTGHLGAAADGSDRRVWALAAADVFVLPAVGEGLPTAALEAMAAGLPLLVSHGCNLPGVEAHGAGALVGTAADRPPTLRDMTAALSAMAAHTPETRRAMGENARRWAAHAFTRTAMLDGLERLYAAVSGRETDW